MLTRGWGEPGEVGGGLDATGHGVGAWCSDAYPLDMSVEVGGMYHVGNPVGKIVGPDFDGRRFVGIESFARMCPTESTTAKAVLVPPRSTPIVKGGYIVLGCSMMVCSRFRAW